MRIYQSIELKGVNPSAAPETPSASAGACGATRSTMSKGYMYIYIYIYIGLIVRRAGDSLRLRRSLRA